jgi:hypothetical protein
MNAYYKETEKPFGYLVVDNKPDTPADKQVLGDLFDDCHIYLFATQTKVNNTNVEPTPSHKPGRKQHNMSYRHGGGVAIYLRHYLNYTVRDDLTDESLETLTLEIMKPKARPFIVNSWYRPTNSSQECLNTYENLITPICVNIPKYYSENKEVILIVDFNCDWSLLANNEANAHTNILAEIINTLQFEQLIKEPTRVTATTKTLIDLAFTNKPELINGSGVIHLGISDHSMIYIQRVFQLPVGNLRLSKLGINLSNIMPIILRQIFLHILKQDRNIFMMRIGELETI